MDPASPHLFTTGPKGPLAAQDAILRCQAALLARDGLALSATALCVELAQLLGCERVTVALYEQNDLRISASSQGGELDPSQQAAAILAAMHEAIDQRLSVAWPASVPNPPISLEHRKLAGTGQSCGVLIVCAGVISGAIMLERPAGEFFTPEQVALCEDIASFAGPVLELKRIAETAWLQRLSESFQGLLARRGRKRSVWSIGLVVGMLLVSLFAALLLPLPWRVSAPERPEGPAQRAVGPGAMTAP